MLLTKDLKWSPDGIRIETISAGEYIEGEIPTRACEIAYQMGLLCKVDESKPVQKGRRKRGDPK